MGAPKMEGLEWSLGSASISTQKQAEAQGQMAVHSISLTGLERARSLPCTEGNSANPTS